MRKTRRSLSGCDEQLASEAAQLEQAGVRALVGERVGNALEKVREIEWGKRRRAATRVCVQRPTTVGNSDGGIFHRVAVNW